MSHPHDQLAAYVDGQLDAVDSAAFERHLVGCGACRDDLHDALQLIALEVTVRNSAPRVHSVPATAPARMTHDSVRATPIIAPMPEATPTQLRRTSRWRRGSRVTIAITAAVAGLVLVIGTWRMRHHMSDGPVASRLVLANAQVRTVEGRISYAAADQHRPYNVARAGSAPSPADKIPFDTFAQLERRNDFHGVAAASMLLGDVSRAAAYLGRAAPSSDVAADRALLQLFTGHPREALISLDNVLRAAPQHPQALWNRALALRDLALTLSAAEAFEAVAALSEPGWADEAHARAQRLSERSRERGAAFKRLALTDGPRLATAPDAVTPEVARRFPGTARLLFYDGIRGAPSANAVRALAPLGHTLDAIYGGDHLSTYVEHIALANFAVRAPLARRYAALVTGEQFDDAATHSLLSALRAARADDILLGALVRTAPHREVDAAEITELRRLADTTGDPWFHLLAVERAVHALIAQGNHVAAEALALPALATCEKSRLDYRCVSLALSLGDSYRLTHRLSEAQRLLTASVGRALRGGEWYLEEEFLTLFAQLEMLSDDVVGSTLPVVRAYTHELVLREPQRCELEVQGSELVALLLVNRVDLDGARTELAHADAVRARCSSTSLDVIVNMFVAAHVLRDPTAGTPDDVDRVRSQIAHARTSAKPGMQVMLDQIEGRLMLDRDRTAGTALLEHAIAKADMLVSGDINGPMARAYAYSLLTLDAGRAGEWDRVWALLGRAAGTPAANRCMVGVAVEDNTSIVVVRDTSGASRGLFNAARSGPAIDAPHLVPVQLRDALRACPEVEVLARPPVQGLPEVLPPEFAWSYRLDGGGGTGKNALAPTRATRVVIADAEPPASLGIARLSPWRSAEVPDVRLEGPAATPSRALEELANATFVEIHSHGVLDASSAEAAFLMLSPDADGRYALTAAAIRQQHLRGRPIVILAACHAARTATYRHESWSLPAAFVAAGARAVIASTEVIEDADAGTFFDDLRARMERGVSPTVALRDARSAWLAVHPAADWVRSLMVFQ